MDTPLIDDDHIIALLRKDAQAGRLGSPFTAERRDKNAPKPNTRFLKNLVRDADSHNAALLAKEKAETKARLKGLESCVPKRSRHDAGSRDDEGSKRPRRGGVGGEREGRWKGVMAGLGKPSLRERDGEGRSERHHKSRVQKTEAPAERIDTEDHAHTKHQSHRRRRSRSPDSRSRSRSPQHRKRSDRDRRSSHRSRSREPKDRKRHHSRDRERRRSRSRSPTRHNHTSKPHRDRDSNRESPNPPPKPTTKPTHTHTSTSDSDSDPLSSFLGPAPPPKIRPRGRGATSANTSTMDLRFNDPSYNPRTDVALSDPESGGEGAKDDWASSLEAMRDRAAWREKGAQRLREAGFGENDVGKWENSGREKDERDLKWRGKGEGREWDAGKVEGEEGEVRVKAAWTKGLGL